MNIGVIAPESHSHVATATNVGRELAALGHRVIYLGVEDVRVTPVAAGLEFLPIGPAEYPRGSVEQRMKQIREARGLRSSILTMRVLGELLDCRLRHLPDLVRGAGIEAMVSDQISPSAGTVCELLGIPVVNICNAVHMNYDFAVPPFFTPWSPAQSAASNVRNRIGYAAFDLVRRGMRKRVNAYRKQHGLAPYRGPHAGMSTLCQISQLCPEIDFDYGSLPPHFRYAGPLNDMEAEQAGTWPEEKLDGRPLVYCSFGTVNNAYHHLYATVLEAFHQLDAQLVLSLGGGEVSLPSRLPPGVIVCDRVPQRQVLQRCRAFITHCGVNSALEGLHYGVPMLCVPIANDQPGMAARLVHHGAAISLGSRRLTAAQLVPAIRSVMNDPSFRHRTKRLQAAIRSSDGAPGAAALIDAVFRTGSIPDHTGA